MTRGFSKHQKKLERLEKQHSNFTDRIEINDIINSPQTRAKIKRLDRKVHNAKLKLSSYSLVSHKKYQWAL